MKTILVTGSSRGIGKAIAALAHNQGYKVIVHGKTDSDELKQSLVDGELIRGAKVFSHNDLDLIEPYPPYVDTLGYVSTNTMTEKVRIKLSDGAKL